MSERTAPKINTIQFSPVQSFINKQVLGIWLAALTHTCTPILYLYKRDINGFLSTETHFKCFLNAQTFIWDRKKGMKK